ncbi:MAG: hypothetical protein R3B68_06440 [Phycisphaerales bacterium]
MPARTSRAGAVKAALFAKAALVLAPAGVAAAIFALPAIKEPQLEVPEFPTGETTAEAGPRVDLGGIGRRMTFVAQFPEPEPIVIEGENGGGEGPIITTPPTTPGVPEIRFLGAIAEPNRYVALLRIDGRQKFLAPGDSYGSVSVVDVTPGEVRLEIDGAPAEAAIQTIALAERSGPRWTEATPAPESTGAAGGGDGANGFAAPAMPNMPQGFTPPPGMSPEQIQRMREFERRRQQAIEQGDGG